MVGLCALAPLAMAALAVPAAAAERTFSFNVTQTQQCGNMTVTWCAPPNNIADIKGRRQPAVRPDPDACE